MKLQKLHFADKIVRLRKVVLLKHMFVSNSNSFLTGVFVNMLQVQLYLQFSVFKAFALFHLTLRS